LEGLYGWIRNLTGYFLFMSVLDNLLPGKKYTRYIRLFSGMVLILLVLQPLTVSLRLEERIAHYYESSVFRYQADNLKQEILGVEKQQLEQLIGQYEHAVEQDLEAMAEDIGFAVQTCRAEIGRQQETETFGTVTGIWMTVERNSGVLGAGDGEVRVDGAARAEEQVHEENPVRPVNPVQIETSAESQISGEGKSPAQPQSHADLQAEAGKLRRKIASYYNLEETYVEIQVVEGKR